MKRPGEEAIQEQLESLISRKMKISSISSDDTHVFVATVGVKGSRYVVWKMDQKFSGGEVLNDGLQLDISWEAYEGWPWADFLIVPEQPGFQVHPRSAVPVRKKFLLCVLVNLGFLELLAERNSIRLHF